MTAVLGIDLSMEASGFCFPDKRCRTIAVPSAGRPVAQRLDEIDAMFRAYLRYYPETDVAILEEVPIHGVNLIAKMRLAQLNGVITLALFQFGVPVVEVNPMSLKKYSTNSGAAQKQDMIKEARNRGYEVANDNEADAALLHQLGRDHYDLPPGWPSLEKHQIDLLDRLTWPRL